YLQVLTCCLAPRVFVAGAARQEGPGVWRAGEDHPTGHYVSRAGLHDPVGPSASAGAHGPISVNGANGAGTSTDTSVRTGAGAGGCAGSVSRLQVLHRSAGVHLPAVSGDVGGQCGREL